MKRAFLLTVINAWLWAAPAPAQVTATSRAFGFNAVNVLGNSDTRFSAPVQRPAVFQGLVQTVAVGTVTVQGTVNWTTSPQQFVYAAGTQPDTFRVEFTSGNKTGMYYTVTGNGSNTLTLDLQGEIIDEEDGVQPGDSLIVVPYWTLDTLFPGQQGITTTTDINGAGAVTWVLVPEDAAAGTDLPVHSTYFYYSGASSGGPGWRKAGAAASDIRNNDVILPDRHLILRQTGVATDQMMVAAGFVPMGTRRHVLGTLAPSVAQDNPLATDLPVAVTLAQSNLIGGAAMAGTSSITGATGDRLLIWDDTAVGTNKAPSKIYFYYNGTASGGPGWRLVGDAATTLHNNDVALQPGSGFVIRKQAIAAPSSLAWALPIPNSPPQMIGPVPGRPLPFATDTFNWAAIAGATQYALWIGSSAGASDLNSSVAVGQDLSRTATLPNDGRNLFVTLRALISGIWQSYAFNYKAPGASWRRKQVTALTDPNANNMADGARTGAAHSVWQLYYYKGTDSNIWCVYWTGTQWSQVQLSNDANVSDWLCFGTIYNLTCYKGNDGKLWCVYWSGAAWLTVQLGNLPAGVTVAGDIVMDNAWNIVYYRGSDSKMYGVQWNGTAWVHVSLGSTATVKSGLAVDPKYHLVYYQGTDNKLWCEQWTGAVWQQVLLAANTNLGGSLAVDSNGLVVYYRSSADNSAWCVNWNGTIWAQVQLDAAAILNSSATSFSSFAPYTQQYVTLYLDDNGQCGVLYWNGTAWSHLLLSDGGSGLTGGLSLQPAFHWAFARRNDGNVVVFYNQ